jgi:hypothetical protein
MGFIDNMKIDYIQNNHDQIKYNPDGFCTPTNPLIIYLIDSLHPHNNDDEYNVAEDDGSQYEQNYEVTLFNPNREVEDEEQSLQSLLSASSSGDESDVSSLQMSNSNQKVASSSKPAAKPLKIPITIKISIRLTSILFSKSDEMSFN